VNSWSGNLHGTIKCWRRSRRWPAADQRACIEYWHADVGMSISCEAGRNESVLLVFPQRKRTVVCPCLTQRYSYTSVTVKWSFISSNGFSRVCVHPHTDGQTDAPHQNSICCTSRHQQCRLKAVQLLSVLCCHTLDLYFVTVQVYELLSAVITRFSDSKQASAHSYLINGRQRPVHTVAACSRLLTVQNYRCLPSEARWGPFGSKLTFTFEAIPQ